MRFLALEQDVAGVTADRMRPWLQAEARAVWALQKSDTLREIWFAQPDRRAVLLLECASETDARAALQTLPLVREGCIAFELMSLQPYDGYERIFRSESSGPPA